SAEGGHSVKRVTNNLLVPLAVVLPLLCSLSACRKPVPAEGENAPLPSPQKPVPAEGEDARFASIRVLTTHRLGLGFLTAPAVSPGGCRVARATMRRVNTTDDIPNIPGMRNTLHVWDLATRREGASIEAGSYISNLAFSPDGSRLASVGKAPDIHFWDT